MSEEEEGHRDGVEIVEEDELEQLKGRLLSLNKSSSIMRQTYQTSGRNRPRKDPKQSDSGHPL